MFFFLLESQTRGELCSPLPSKIQIGVGAVCSRNTLRSQIMVLSFSHQLVLRLNRFEKTRCLSVLSETHRDVVHVASVLETFPHLRYVPRSLARFRLELEQCVFV
jgi:hypothetical protein